MRFGNKKKNQTWIIECPGLWMSESELNRLRSDLQQVVGTLGIGALDYGVIRGDKEALDRAVITMVYDGPTGRPMAFNALSLMNCTLKGESINVLHLGLIVIDPTVRAKGLSWILYGLTTLLLFMKNQFRPIWVSNVTQVPAIIGMVSEGFSEVYPNPLAQTRKSFDHIVLVREIMGQYRHVFGVGTEAEFDEENFLIKNSYTGGSDHLKKTFEQAPKHRSAIYNEYARSALDYERGDDVIQIGKMDLSSYYRYMAHQLPKGSLLVIAAKFLFSIMESRLVPALQWFMAHKKQNNLKPRMGFWI